MEILIDTGAIASVSNPKTGDCASVAVALQKTFGGQLVCLYDPEDERLPCHVLVEREGQFFDGTGVRPLRDFVEIHLVLTGDLEAITDPQEYIVFEEPPEYMVDDTVVSAVRRVL